MIQGLDDVKRRERMQGMGRKVVAGFTDLQNLLSRQVWGKRQKESPMCLARCCTRDWALHPQKVLSLALVFCLAGARLVPSSGSQFFQAAVQDHSPVDLRLNFWSWGTFHESWWLSRFAASSLCLSIFVIRTWLNGCMVGWKDVEGLNRPIFWWPAYTLFFDISWSLLSRKRQCCHRLAM